MEDLFRCHVFDLVLVLAPSNPRTVRNRSVLYSLRHSDMATQNEPRISALVLKCVHMFSQIEGSLWSRLGKQALPPHLHGGEMLLSLDMLATKELGTGPSQTA